MPHTMINGFEMYYERHGDAGEPLVFVHGYTGDVGDWEHQIAEFASTHRVLALDHRGHGRSEGPADRSTYTIEQMSHDVEELIGRAGFERYHLVGHSMGGAVTQEIALRRPGRLMSLTLHDTGPGFNLSAIEVVRRYFAERLRVAEEQGMAALAEMPSPLPDPPNMTPERRAYEKKRLAAMSVHGLAGAWNALNTWPGTRERAHAIATPTMVIYGELDLMVKDGMEFLARTIPGAHKVVVEGAAHSPQFERPEVFNAALRRHIERWDAAVAK
jgi:pimeloyl-ACP methyl ester carboxylesterase